MYTIRCALYWIFISNPVVAWLRSRFLQVLLPPVIGAYWTAMQIYGDEWYILVKFKDVHELLFIVICACGLVVIFLRGIADTYIEKNTNDRLSISRGFITFCGSIVQAKKDRFREKFTELTASGDVFSKITRPEEQIPIIMREVLGFIETNFGVRQKNSEITIMHHDLSTKKWHYAFKSRPNKSYINPNQLLDKPSTAKEVRRTGEPLFVADIRKGEKERVFYYEDSRKLKGSIYSYPIFIERADGTESYIININTWNQFLCTPYDSDECIATELILREIASRLELELTLQSMKNYRKTLSSREKKCHAS